YKVVSVKMDTLEKSFQYLKSHVLAVASQEELAKEIDDLITGVEAVESLDSETEGLISDLGRARAARQALKGEPGGSARGRSSSPRRGAGRRRRRPCRGRRRARPRPGSPRS